MSAMSCYQHVGDRMSKFGAQQFLHHTNLITCSAAVIHLSLCKDHVRRCLITLIDISVTLTDHKVTK